MRISLLAVLSVFAASCDTPGGAPSGPCADDPSLPQCQHDTREPDVDIETTVDIGPEAECVDGLTRCDASNDLVETCVGGRFVATAQCGEAATCVEGRCVVDDVCPGDDCSPHGDANCTDVMRCVIDNGCLRDGATCAAACIDDGTVEVQTDVLDIVRCYAEEWNNTGDRICVPRHVACAYPTAGDESCSALMACDAGCAGDAVCRDTCVARADVEAQANFIRLVVCPEIWCQGDRQCSICQAAFFVCELDK